MRRLEYNSNLDVIDEAFEYLINQSSKGEKGQFFTPRYVIDMCVKMLNPQEDEYMIDTAAGSSGFPVHTIFYVWRQILDDEGLEASHLFSLEDKPPRCKEYVEDKVFAIDFDEKAVRVARTLNLIAGDGQTNVLHLNTLDYELWDEVTDQDDWDDVYHEGFRRLKKRRSKGSKDYREFQFDLLMANPPFAGDIKEPRMIARYDLAKKPNGKWQTKVGRDILFIERNLDFLKPGGRMAIVLPQGRFNNSSDKNIRNYIAERCRILAVVGLHGNTFKPHTGTKTSVLLVQTWNDDRKAGPLCPRQDDYNIFFATMQKSGKDNSGDKIWRKIISSTASPPDDELSELMPPSPAQRVVGGEGDFLQDEHGHLVVDHDLYNHEGLTEDGIAEAFIEFAKKEKFSFFEPSPSVTPFDAVRYQRLMDGLEAIEVLLSEALKNKDFRVDSEFHRRPPVQNPNYIYVDVGDNLTFIQYGLSIEMNEEGEGTKIYRMNEIHNMLCDIDVSKFANISPIDMKAFRLKERDILFNRTNSFDFVGRTGLFKECSDENFVFASYLIRARTDESKVLPEYLVAFLNSSLGIWDVKRRARISINQSNVNAQELAAVKIPLLSLEFQERLKELFNQAHLDRLKAIDIYQQAEDLLLSELGLQGWQPTEETVAVKSFAESFLSSGRLDAEYYQPKQQKVMAIMRQSGLCIGDVVTLAKRKFQPEKEGSFNYIEIGNLSGEGFANSEVVAMEEAPSRAQWIVETNDVITSAVRPIRRLSALIEPEQNNYICSSGFAVLKPTQIEPEVLLVYLRSPIVYEILDLHTTASMYPAISTEDLLNIPITLPKETTRQKIAEKVRESRKAREQSKQLLEIAKTGVERAIETDEATATTWINEQLEVLNIKPT
ncbi:N-6 DNA methylase [Romeria aff. gracilis LEGE 07310]|uniref:N-6 DNA methylase n=1 Tax=Vasconcelosia minhoensis LEGE 07310 TaxID=915328 RepID=A0A8J7DDS9_9CYAN|nr:N-6 DNA methylase [Romeria aff. gracilis LEGE 07310]